MFKLRKYNGYDPFNLRKSPIPLFYRRGCYDAGLGANYYDMVISGYYNKLHEFNGSYFRACNLDDNFLKPYEEETSANIIFELRKNI